MDVLSISPFCAGSVLWRPRPDRFSLTVVCKATYALSPGESELAEEQELICDRDRYFDDDPRRSLYVPSDLAPFKPRADVLLVGHAYAPRSELVRSLTARLIVGGVEKAVEVFCARVASRGGELREGARWNKMPLRYEYAAGGPETWNPVGVAPHALADMYGQHTLPNLAPPGLRAAQWSDNFVPTGFGPLSPAWRVRREKLGRRAEGWSDEGWTQIALDDDFDGEFFQAAPADQQLEAIQDDERIVLEYLNLEHPSLATRLPGIHPRAFVETTGGSGARDLIMTADTLWIDCDRAICTVTWRGQVAVDGPDHPGRVLIAMEEEGQRLNWTAVSVKSRSGGTLVPAADPEARSHRQTLPFVSSEPPTPLPPSPRMGPPTQFAGTLVVARPAPGAAAAAHDGGTPPVPMAPSADPTPPAPPRALGPRQTVQMINPAAPAASAVAKPGRLGPGFQLGSQSLRTIEATQVSMRIDDLRAAASARAAGAPAAELGKLDIALEVLWFAPGLAARAHRVEAFEPLLPAPKEGAGLSDGHAAALLLRGSPSSADLTQALFEDVNDAGALAPTPRVLAGELAFPFDETAQLRALIVAATPMARIDPRLAEALELAEEMTKTPLHGSPEVAEGLCVNIQEAWTYANQALPPDHLSAQAHRALLAQRAYQRRELLGKRWLRALLVPPGATEGAAVPALLPAAIATRLPLYASFTARLVAEVLPRQDQYEASPVVLRVLALARVIAREG